MLTISIVNWNTKEHLKKCLRSIKAHPLREPHEVVVVDNASTDGSAEMVKKEFPWVRLIPSETNLGYAKANNLVLAQSRGDFFLTLNPDTEFLDDSLQKAVDILRSKPKVGALTGCLLNPDRSVQGGIRSFPTPWAIFCDATCLGKIFPKSRLFTQYRMPLFDYTREAKVEQPMGTFLLFQMKALKQVGPFDERFPIFFNEVDLLYRLKKAGWEILYTPEVKILHYGGASTRQVRKKMIWESHKSLIRFYHKWYLRWWNVPLILLFDVLVGLTALIRAKGYDPGFRP
ncbi:MAG: glycosyltransferase family 2 protein [Candidatus Caldarchaeum sp.]